MTKQNAPSPTLLKLADLFDAIINTVSQIASWTTALLLAVIVVNVVMRYGFNKGLIVFEEIQWHLYAIGIIFGLSYAEQTNSQVRVDVVASRLNRRTVIKWEIFGTVFFVLPLIFVFIYNSIDYVATAYTLNERSNSPLGLPYRWAIKAVIPIGFTLLGLAITSKLIRNFYSLADNNAVHQHPSTQRSD